MLKCGSILNAPQSKMIRICYTNNAITLLNIETSCFHTLSLNSRLLGDEREGRRRQRTGSHCKEAETTVLRVHDQSTEPLYIQCESKQ